MHRFLLFSIIGLVLLGTVITLGQIWASFIGWDIYIKAMVTIGILVLVLAFLMVVRSDFGSQEDLKDNNYLD